MEYWIDWRVFALVPVLGLTLRAAPVTFFRDIAPIVHRNCSPCHKPGEAAPFSLLTYEDVKKHARQIADVTRRRYMPPWLPAAGFGAFVEERRLSDEQIRLIDEWVKHGALAGSPTGVETAPPATDSEWKLGKPDLELHVQRAYRLPADGPEIFWNFVIPVPVSIPRWVKSVEIRPGAAKVVHHASILVDRAGSARSHEASPGAGFPGMDVSIHETRFDPDGVFLAWKPGSTTNVEPEGIAWRADPGMNLVFSVHLRPSGKPETVDPVIALYFTETPPTKFPMLVALERDASIDIPPGDRDYIVTDTFRCPIDVEVLAVYPHAHYLGKRLDAYATLPDSSRKWLIRIPDWDLNWQGVFHFRKPVSLPRGSVITMSFHYDNSEGNVRNPHNPPRRVHGGAQADDEMGNLWLQLLPAGEGDQRAIIFEAIMQQRLERSPDDFLANYNLGELALNNGRPVEAVTFFEAAWKVQPRNVVAATELGVALMSVSKIQEAKLQFQRALEIDPSFTDARYDLASAEAAGEEWEAAAAEFQRVVTERPDDLSARQHLGEVLLLWGDQFAGTGNFEEAVKRYDSAIPLRAHDPELRMNLGNALVRLGRLSDARAQFQAALRLEPESQAAKRALEAVDAQQRGKPR
jgi:Flp pilus assembly protein TadD